MAKCSPKLFGNNLECTRRVGYGGLYAEMIYNCRIQNDAAGFYETYYSPRLKEFVEIPRSMSFASMDDVEFSECYDRIKDVIWGILSKRVGITQEMFERYLANY